MRDERIDILRFTGLSAIILAHVGPPPWLLQIRNFDVPLMVVVSGLAFSNGSAPRGYIRYLWHRVKRLVFPVWIFLSILFLTDYIFAHTTLPAPHFSRSTIVSSYLLTKGIGYVWIIRVFLLVAIAAPAILELNNKISSAINYYLVVIFFYVLYFVVYKDGMAGILENDFLFYLVPYSLIFSIGIRISRASRNEILITGGVFTAIFLSLACLNWLNHGGFVPTQEFKYPPRLYYISYALSLSVFLWYGSAFLVRILEIIRLKDIATFVGKNSIWIYLWHIPCVFLSEKSGYLNFLGRYAIVYITAVGIVLMQGYLVDFFANRLIRSERAKRNVFLLLKG